MNDQAEIEVSIGDRVPLGTTPITFQVRAVEGKVDPVSAKLDLLREGLERMCRTEQGKVPAERHRLQGHASEEIRGQGEAPAQVLGPGVPVRDDEFEQFVPSRGRRIRHGVDTPPLLA